MFARTGLLLLVSLGLTASPLPAQSSSTLADRAARLQIDGSNAIAVHHIRDLHIAYTQLAEVGLWQDMADLFADDAQMIVGDRTLNGKGAIGQWIRDELGNGKDGLASGEVRTLLPFTPVINLGADGKSAKGRWHELSMVGAFGKEARWAGGIYENDYVKQGAVWKIARMHYYPQFAGSYADGWRNIEPDLKVVPMHYTPQTAGIALPQIAAPPSADDPASVAAKLNGTLSNHVEKNAVRNLQNIYGYYVDRRMWDDVADLFEADATLDIAGLGQWRGSKSIRRGLEREGPAGLPAGTLNEHVQFPPIITMSPDGREARARGLELALTGENAGKGYWAVSIFENRYVKRDGVWRIAQMQTFPRFRSDYAEGWGKSRLDPVAPNEAQKPDAPSALQKGSLPAFSWRHPVTGQPIRYPEGTRTAGEFPTFGAPVRASSSTGSPAQQIAEAERKQRLLAADIGAENVSNAFGNYIDDFEWELLGELFAEKGAREMPFAGYYIGPKRIATAEITKWGHRRSPRTGIPIHLRMQPVIDVAADGRSARFRTRLFSIGSNLNTAGSFSGGMYPNDQAVLEKRRLETMERRHRRILLQQRWL